MSVQVFTLPPLPAVSQPGPLSLELRVASGMRGMQGSWSLLSNKGILMGEPGTASSLLWWELIDMAIKHVLRLPLFCLFLL